MKYVYNEFVKENEIMAAEAQNFVINARFCRDCPLFEQDYWQSDPNVIHGWCRRMSYYRTLDDEAPYYVHVNSNSFCNEDDIVEGDE